MDSAGAGDHYAAPADDVLRQLRCGTDSELHGFLAGSSVVMNLPKLKYLLDNKSDSNYAWAPLARRLDIDRVHGNIKASGRFLKVVPFGTKTGHVPPGANDRSFGFALHLFSGLLFLYLSSFSLLCFSFSCFFSFSLLAYGSSDSGFGVP
jgi:hypothetical protein